MKTNVHTRPVTASLYSQHSPSTSAANNTTSSSSRSHPFSSISLSPEGGYAVASGRDVLHVLRLSVDKNIGESIGGESDGITRLEEIRAVRISQVNILYCDYAVWA